MIIHDELGALEYKKVYMGLDKPHIFLCWFEKTPYDLYLGMLMDEYDVGKYDPTQKGTINTTYYFVQVDETIIKNLEAGRYTLRQVFMEWPVLWVVHQQRGEKHACVWQKRSCAAPYYSINDTATLAV